VNDGSRISVRIHFDEIPMLTELVLNICELNGYKIVPRIIAEPDGNGIDRWMFTVEKLRFDDEKLRWVSAV
jgi:hypothetical protein